VFKEKEKVANTIKRMSLINDILLNGVCFMKDLLLFIEMMRFSFVYEQFFTTVLRHLSSTLHLFIRILNEYRCGKDV
jgi:hypothetical protein